MRHRIRSPTCPTLSERDEFGRAKPRWGLVVLCVTYPVADNVIAVSMQREGRQALPDAPARSRNRNGTGEVRDDV